MRSLTTQQVSEDSELRGICSLFLFSSTAFQPNNLPESAAVTAQSNKGNGFFSFLPSDFILIYYTFNVLKMLRLKLFSIINLCGDFHDPKEYFCLFLSASVFNQLLTEFGRTDLQGGRRIIQVDN